MKKPSLFAALKTHDTRPQLVQPTEEQARKPGGVQPGRVGQKQVLGYFSPECKKQLRQMRVDLDTTEQELLTEALNLLFQKHGKPTLA